MLLFLLIARIQAQSYNYTRKSISYIDVLLFTESGIDRSDINVSYFLSAIHDGISLSRFDYNPLPYRVQESFRKRALEKKGLSDSEISILIEETIVPELLKILDIQKEMRAQELVTETQRNSFIALKAKEIGITATQLEQVMNSAYLYVPFISNYTLKLKEKKDDDEKKEYSVKIKGGLVWYHLIAGDNPVVEKTGKIIADGWGNEDNEDSAFRLAVQVLAMNLRVKTREMDIFKLQAPIAEVYRRTVRFPLGKAEGIRMDDPFYVGEWMETKKGRIKLETSGFVRVGTVADNRNSQRQLSSAWAVKKGDWVRGMMVVEHPRLGIDIVVKPRWFTMNIKEGLFSSEDFLVYFNDYQGGALGIDVDIQWNIANIVKKRQTFLVLGGSGGFVPVKSRIYDSAFDVYFNMPTESIAAGVVNGHLGFMRKYYIGSFALHWETLLGIQMLSVSDSYKDENVTISNNSLGARINLGLEYAFNIDCNIGVFAGFTMFPPMDWWTIKYDDEEVDVENYTSWAAPKIYSFGPTLGLYVHYSPPTLPFNPLAMIQSQIDKAVR